MIQKSIGWILKAFSASDEVSIKRITGFIIVICLLMIVFLVCGKVIPAEVWKSVENFCEILFYGSCALMGINAIIDVAKIKSGKE